MPETARFPMTLESIFENLDLPEVFINEKTDAPYFRSVLNDLEGCSPEDSAAAIYKSFLVYHISSRLLCEINYYYAAMESTGILKTPAGKDSFLYGIFAIIYSTWDYNFQDPNIGIESGKQRFLQYFDENFYQDMPEKQKFIKYWVSQKFNKERFITIMDSIKRPFGEIPDSVSETDRVVIQTLRDTIIYAPFFSLIFYPESGLKFILYELLITFLIQYNISSLEEIDKCLKMFYMSGDNPEPEIEFTKNLVNEYKSQNKHVEDGFLTENFWNLSETLITGMDYRNLKEKIESLSETAFSTFEANSPIF